MRTILTPSDGNLELYEKDCERTKRNLYAYENQFSKSYSINIQSVIEYAAELIAYERSEARFWKSIVMEGIMEDRRKARLNKNAKQN